MTNLEPRTEIALNNILFATDFRPRKLRLRMQ